MYTKLIVDFDMPGEFFDEARRLLENGGRSDYPLGSYRISHDPRGMCVTYDTRLLRLPAVFKPTDIVEVEILHIAIDEGPFKSLLGKTWKREGSYASMTGDNSVSYLRVTGETLRRANSLYEDILLQAALAALR